MREGNRFNLAGLLRRGLVCLAALALAPALVFGADRGRPHLSNDFGYNRLLTDKNTSLRGVSLAWDGGSNNNDPVNVPSQAQLNALATTYGLNNIHVYLEQENQTIGHNAANCDLLVDRASAAGLYVIITIGCGDHNGQIINYEWCKQFWAFYAPRYKNRTHVIYESHNEPGPYNPAAWTSVDWWRQVDLYYTIRDYAPNTHILTCTFMSFNDAPAALSGIAYMKSCGVDFSNASVAFHGYETMASVENCITTFQKAEGGTTPALLCTEFDPGTTSSGFNNMIETHFIGWIEFTFLTASDYDLTNFFKPAINANGVLWTPDFGDWPSHSATQEPINSRIKLVAAANSKYVCAENWGNNPLIASQTGGGNWETFTLRYKGTNLVAFEALVNAKFVCAANYGNSPLIASATAASTWETFEWYYLPNNKIALRSCINGKLVCADNFGNSALIAKSSALGTWEQFTWSY